MNEFDEHWMRKAYGNTLCPKIGAAQWTCTREECTCHRREYAHNMRCAYRDDGECDCGAKPK